MMKSRASGFGMPSLKVNFAIIILAISLACVIKMAQTGYVQETSVNLELNDMCAGDMKNLLDGDSDSKLNVVSKGKDPDISCNIKGLR